MMQEPGKGNLWVGGLSCKIFGKRKTWKWFLNAPPTCQTDAQHSSWAPQCPASSLPIPAEMIKSFTDPLKHKHFSPAVPSGCFSFYRQSAERLICWDINGAVCMCLAGGGGASGCLHSTVYVMDRGVVRLVWQEKNIDFSENSEAQGKIKPWMLSEVYVDSCQEWSASAYSCSITPSYWVSFTPVLSWTSLMTQMVKCLPTMWETWVWSLGWEDPLEKEIATHSSTLAWKTPWTEEPHRLQSMGSQRVEHDCVTSLSFPFVL